jgi:hypothetical protein
MEDEPTLSRAGVYHQGSFEVIYYSYVLCCITNMCLLVVFDVSNGFDCSCSLRQIESIVFVFQRHLPFVHVRYGTCSLDYFIDAVYTKQTRSRDFGAWYKGFTDLFYAIIKILVHSILVDRSAFGKLLKCTAHCLLPTQQRGRGKCGKKVVGRRRKKRSLPL